LGIRKQRNGVWLRPRKKVGVFGWKVEDGNEREIWVETNGWKGLRDEKRGGMWRERERERERDIEMERVRSGQDDENGETIGRSRNEAEKLALVFRFIL
jgi:hypothetical protein